MGGNKEDITHFKQQMLDEFEMSDIGELNYFLGIEFTKIKHGIIMHQTKYTQDLLKRFRMENSNPAITPAEAGLKLESAPDEEFVNATDYRRIVGSLRYLCNSIPDLSFSVGLISRHMQDPKESHMCAAKRILRYLQGTIGSGILFPHGKADSELQLVGYSDSDWCGDRSDRKSTAGYIFFLGGAPISCK